MSKDVKQIGTPMKETKVVQLIYILEQEKSYLEDLRTGVVLLHIDNIEERNWKIAITIHKINMLKTEIDAIYKEGRYNKVLY